MARTSQQFQHADDSDPAEWQSLRSELVALLDQVEGRMGQRRSEPSAGDRGRDMRQALADSHDDARHRDALRQVQRAITRFEEPAPMPPNPRDSLQAAIDQIRSRQGVARPAATGVPIFAPPQPSRAQPDAAVLDRLAQSVGGLSGRLERLENEIRVQVKGGASVKDVADQVAQLAHVVELLAGAVGETGQVKRLEGQIASLGKLLSQGREMDLTSLTRRLDDVAGTVGKLADLQVHFVDKVENPVASQAFKDGMAAIEQGVRNVYDRIDSLERSSSASPGMIEHLVSEMARFTEAMRMSGAGPQNLVELIDALNSRIADIEGGDRLLHALRRDLSSLRDAVIVSLKPRFDAIDERMETLSTRDDMAEIGRQIGALSSRMDRPFDVGIGQLEAQVRQLVARMDQTGDQLNTLSRMYADDPAQRPDLAAMADVVAERAAEVIGRRAEPATAETISGLEARITTLLQSMRRDPETDDFTGVQAGISEVNERLKRLEDSLLARAGDAAGMPASRFSDAPRHAMFAPTLASPMPVSARDPMPRSPAEETPLTDTPFADPSPIANALEARSRRWHPGLAEDDTLAARHDAPAAAQPPASFEPAHIEAPPAPQPSAGFAEAAIDVEEGAQVTAASRNTFIEAARRAGQRQKTGQAPPAASANSLIGRALSRFQVGTADGDHRAALAAEPAAKATRVKTLAGSPEPRVMSEAPVSKLDGSESFLTRNRKIILMGAAVVAVAFLSINLIAQRLQPSEASAEAATPIDAGPQTTGALDAITLPSTGSDADTEPSLPPRVIPMVDTLTTGAIDTSTAAQGFAATSPQAMPSAFEAATQVATADIPASVPDAGLPPLAESAPIKVDMPPENIGPAELRQAAANGDARAQFEIAAIYTEGRAVQQDYAAAAMWYERAAAQGFVPAEYRLGSLYESGNGVGKDLSAARLWYERAAEAGNRMSMHNLAALYAGGQMGKQQFDSAAKWFEEAAGRGLVDSQFNLGMLYARGLGVPQNLETSYKWFGIAALSGDKDAAKARDDMGRSLDAATLARVEDEVTAFKPQPIELAANFAPIGTWMKSFDPGETITTKDIVLNVQKALGKLGYDIGTPDGVAGKKTAEAIKSFEAGTGMSQVGLINPRLLAVLGSQPV